MKPVIRPIEAREEAGQGSNLSTGITRLPMSTAVFHALYRPIENLPGSTEIYGCLPCLLSVLILLANCP